MDDTGIKTSDKYKNWQPDGLALDLKTKILYLLEFTRCSDSRISSLPEAIKRKEIKYDELLTDI